VAARRAIQIAAANRASGVKKTTAAIPNAGTNAFHPSLSGKASVNTHEAITNGTTTQVSMAN
jgi:hypothetical protein